MLRKLAGQTAIYGISSILSRLLNYLLVPYLTYNILSTSAYGVVSDMYSIIPFVMILLTMGMETGYFRFAGKTTSAAEQRRIFATTWGAVSALSLVFLCVGLLFRNQIAEVMGYSAHVSYVTTVIFIIALDAITAIPFAKLRQEGRAVLFVVIRFVNILLNVFFCVFFYSILPKIATAGSIFSAIYDPSYESGYVYVANLIASTAVLLLLLPICRVMPRIDFKLFRTIFLYSIPLLLSGIVGTANELIDRQMIKYILPEEIALSALGIYSAVAKTAILIVLFTQMYRYAAEPFFLSGFKKTDFVKANAVALKYYVIVAVGIFLLITLYVDVFALFIGTSFREGIPIMPVMLVSNLLAGILFNLSFWYKYAEKTKYALYVTLLGFAFTLSLNLLLIPLIGYQGAAWARLGCELSMVSFSYYLNQKYYPVPYDLPGIFTYLGIGAAIYALTTIITPDSLFVKYTLHTLLLLAFGVFAIRHEKIDVLSIIRSIKR